MLTWTQKAEEERSVGSPLTCGLKQRNILLKLHIIFSILTSLIKKHQNNKVIDHIKRL